jgi:hypothetical protein
VKTTIYNITIKSQKVLFDKAGFRSILVLMNTLKFFLVGVLVDCMIMIYSTPLLKPNIPTILFMWTLEMFAELVDDGWHFVLCLSVIKMPKEGAELIIGNFISTKNEARRLLQGIAVIPR